MNRLPAFRTVYLSLGSNLGNRENNLWSALQRLSRFCKVRRVSSFYETEPIGLVRQPWFLNCVVEAATKLAPAQLLKEILEVEKKGGRKRQQPKAAREIDIDILLFGDLVVQQKRITIPHPAMHLRRFVLEPLAEIAPHALHPVFMRSAGDLLASLKDSAATRKLEK